MSKLIAITQYNTYTAIDRLKLTFCKLTEGEFRLNRIRCDKSIATNSFDSSDQFLEMEVSGKFLLEFQYE